MQVLTVYVVCTCTDNIYSSGIGTRDYMHSMYSTGTTGDYICGTCNKGTGVRDYINQGTKAGRCLHMNLCRYK
jgi:hypothetical protein